MTEDRMHRMRGHTASQDGLGFITCSCGNPERFLNPAAWLRHVGNATITENGKLKEELAVMRSASSVYERYQAAIHDNERLQAENERLKRENLTLQPVEEQKLICDECQTEEIWMRDMTEAAFKAWCLRQGWRYSPVTPTFTPGPDTVHTCPKCAGTVEVYLLVPSG